MRHKKILVCSGNTPVPKASQYTTYCSWSSYSLRFCEGMALYQLCTSGHCGFSKTAATRTEGLWGKSVFFFHAQP